MISSISFVRKLDHVYYGECRTMYRPIYRPLCRSRVGRYSTAFVRKNYATVEINPNIKRRYKTVM